MHCVRSRLALMRQPAAFLSVASARPLVSIQWQSHEKRHKQTRLFSKSALSSKFMDPYKFIEQVKEAGEKPLANYSIPSRYLFEGMYELSEKLEEFCRDVTEEELKRGRTMEEIRNLLRWLWTLSVVMLVLTPFVAIFALRELLRMPQSFRDRAEIENQKATLDVNLDSVDQENQVSDVA